MVLRLNEVEVGCWEESGNYKSRLTSDSVQRGDVCLSGVWCLLPKI